MKRNCHILLLLLVCSITYGQQFYLRGEIKDESGNTLQNVNILLHSTGYIYRSGADGSFGIVTSWQKDSLSFSFDGYYKQTIAVNADNYLVVKMKMLPANISALRRDKLISLTSNLTRESQREWFTGDETYASIVENRFVDAAKYPSTTVSLNIDRASYSNIRRFINMGTLVPPDAVRIEEMLNYFNNNYKQPELKSVFNIQSIITSCPWNQANQLFFVNVCSQKLNLDSLPASNLVFLIDVSGSMDMPNRLPLLKSAFKLLINNLRAKDTVSIVVYGGLVATMLNPTSGAEKDSILRVIDELEPGGATPGESGIRLAYRIAANHFIKKGNNRVILATDGDFNVGLKKEEDLEEMIARQRQSGIYLTCLGVGMGNYKDSKIQSLARKGNGNFAYLDNYREAEKVLLKEFSQTLYAVADEVYMNIEFNKQYVKEYRLIGFDNKMGALKDSLSEVEGGEVGSGQSMMAVFEVIPADKKNVSGNYAKIQLNYKLPGNKKEEKNFTYESAYQTTLFTDLPASYKFSSAVIMLGLYLKQSSLSKEINLNDVTAIARQSAQQNNLSQQEFINLVQQAKMLYSKKKRKGRWQQRIEGIDS
ncbi:MAG: von Willebrand factor type A domain-containing protein [Bacteroidetes bacterium]|nr:von Willebrand factor type A domain-containing protein [Bacteroidota bacterium]